MAKLTETQLKRKIVREKQKQATVQKKMEIQKKKELYGENWKAVEQQKLEAELELEIGSNKTPKIYDSKDLYDFFDPINFYKDEQYQNLKMDFKRFRDSEIKYEKSLKKVNEELASISDKIKKAEISERTEFKNGIEQKDKYSFDGSNMIVSDKASNEKTVLELNDFNEILKRDGTSAEDDVQPLVGKIEEAGEKIEASAPPEGDNEFFKKMTAGIKEDQINQKIEELKGDANKVLSEEELKSIREQAEQEVSVAKSNSARARAKQKLNQMAATYFNRFVPLYDKHVCTCCGIPKSIDDYYIVYNLTCTNRVDSKGNYHMWICKECCQKLLMYYYTTMTDKNVELAMQFTCTHLNLYWNVDYYYKAKKDFENNGRRGTLIGSYISLVNKEAVGLSLIDSPFLVDEQYNSANRTFENTDDAPFDWDAQDARNKKTVLRMIGYDPFKAEKEEDKKILYNDLLNILDVGMENDFVKLQAALQIVQSFFKIRKMNEKITQMENEGATPSELKGIIDIKSKEMTAITNFSRDNGFAERYATAKAKGENTLTGIMSKMNEQKYEKGILNRYDVETSATIQQAADASFKAIFGQLSMGESEVWKITQDQFEQLTKLRKELSKTQEDLRLARYELAEIKLTEQAKKRDEDLGIEEDDE